MKDKMKPQPPEYYYNLYFGNGLHSYLNRKRISQLIKLIPKNSSVLDAGCGSGILTKILTNDYVVGIDNDAAAIKLAKGKNPKSDFFLKDIRYRFDLLKKFDVVVCSNTLEHFHKEDRIKVLMNLDKHLKKDGLMVVVTPSVLFMLLIEPIFKKIRRIMDPGIKFDDEDIHEKVYDKEILSTLKQYRIVKKEKHCYWTMNCLVLKKVS